MDRLEVRRRLRAWRVGLLMALGLAGSAQAGEVAAPAAAGALPLEAAKQSAATDARAELACASAGNCVNSFDSDGPGPLRFQGTPQQALETLQATLARFPEAQVVRSEPLALEVIFTTLLGFRDQVDFRIDPQGGRIDYRSKSRVGRYDFGKNRSRMREFVERFEAAGRP